MIRRLLFTYLTLTLFVLAILEIPLGLTFARHERRVLGAEVERDAFVMAGVSEDVLEGTGTADLPAFVDAYQARTGGRAVIVDRAGQRVADSDPLSPGAVNFSTRPEIRTALQGAVASGIRRSETLDEDLLYVAVPVTSGNRILGAVRITFPTSAVDARIVRNWMALGLVAAVVVASSLLLGWRFASSVTKPLKELEHSTESLARGDLSARVERPSGPPEVRSVAHTFNEMAARLEELVVSQRAFVADASHQLRTPLTALRLRLETLEEGVPAELLPDAEAAGLEAWRLEAIVEGLLVLARAEATHPERRTVDVARVIADRHQAWSPLAAERSVSIRAAPIDESVWEVPGALHQILDNLLANALRASPPGATIRISSVARGTMVEIHVIDEGSGMAEEQRARAFDRFWRATDEDDGGSGLGLPIVRQLARAAGGDAYLDASAEGGIDAWVSLEHADPGRIHEREATPARPTGPS